MKAYCKKWYTTDKNEAESPEPKVVVISFEPISESPASKSFHVLGLKSVRVDLIGTFHGVTTRELEHIT